MLDDLFAPERHRPESTRPPWYVLVVDDEPEVHQITQLALKHFNFDGRPLVFLNAYSGSEARKLLRERHRDIAMALLDVVMESDDAGLALVDYIRSELNNHFMRLVLRTGQPGQAPEQRVIVDYDINDYKAKTELTAQKLSTLMYASLRSYRDIMTIDGNRRGLVQVIEASANIFQRQSLMTLLEGVVEQLTGLLHLDKGVLIRVHRQYLALAKDEGLEVLVAIDANRRTTMNDSEALSFTDRTLIMQAMAMEQHLFTQETAVLVCHHGHDQALVFYLEGGGLISQLDRNLLELFMTNVAIAFDNLRLRDEVEETQREIVYLLGETVESRSHETGQHVKRVAEYCYILAKAYGLSEEQAQTLRYAAPLHDLGKISVPDHILYKEGVHTDQEREVMRAHSSQGYELLRHSQRPILNAAAVIALEHHEKWDGSGYPSGKRGEEIHLYARIVALADVFDAVCSPRCYKEPWSLEKTLAHIESEKGKHFDPELVAVFMQQIDALEAVRLHYLDEESSSQDLKH
ncbi:DUF3369 domain-containing protein [Pokkaliibacter sp. CJK22405]|uniref:DUF3369 domain-containing protein n=1 Tax=Pokkaliibacter sp. CJK22405 TaxID=3384615 RepID=UPI0039850240